MTTWRRVLAVVCIAAVGIAALYGSRALAETLGLAGDERQSYPLTSDPNESFDSRAVAPRGNWSEAEARAFDRFALFWAGKEHAGLPLTAIIRARYLSAERPGVQVYEDSVTFLYGSCIPPEGEGGCAAPFQVIVGDACQSPPGVAPDVATNGPPFTFRGALAQEYADGHIQLWTQDVSVTIFGPDAESMRALASALRPLNPLARLGADGQLQAPLSIPAPRCPPLSPASSLHSVGQTP